MSVKVLIVEDEFIVANDLRLILEQAGYTVNGIAASAEEADEHLLRSKPDVVIVDIRLNGELSGIDFARKLRLDNIAFIYLSANSSRKVLEEARITEPYGFLIKPFREKDLLVTLDIALYRHKHSLETKLRQEEFLQKQLMAICDDTPDAKRQLLQFARVIQAHIPFDLIVSGPRPLHVTELDDIAYLRIGFDEYQFIGIKELMTITGVEKHTLSQIVGNTGTDSDAMIYVADVVKHKAAIPPLQKMWFDSFTLQSCMVFPVPALHTQTTHFSFYSRQRDLYTKHHIGILSRLKVHLTALVENMFYYKGAEAVPANGRRAVYESVGDVMPQAGFKNIIGNHPLLLGALDLTMQVAPYNTSVLLLGESGTGKERIAQSLHCLSPRKNGPFVRVNCAAIPANLIESELFGHEKGAFTGAFEKRKGKFEQAHGGTIFLDEIGELPLSMQVKLLRVLQEKEIETVGGNTLMKIDVRIIAATNRNLEKEVAEGNFRLDLYYRLNVFPITLPPLRDRKTDIETLVLFFANKFCNEFNKPFPGISAVMMEEMMAYHWPGNIRELENVMEQAVILNDGTSALELKRSLVVPDGLPVKANITSLEDVKQVQSETERAYIISVLRKANGRIRGVNGAAELLNIKPTTLESKIARLHINRTDFL